MWNVQVLAFLWGTFTCDTCMCRRLCTVTANTALVGSLSETLEED